MKVNFIEFDGIKEYARVMYNDVKEADKKRIEVMYNGQDIKDLLEYLFDLEQRIDKLEEENKESEEAVYYWQKQCDLKQKVIDKAIKHIKNKEKELEEIKGYDLLGNDYWHFNIKLLEILKGSDKE